MTYTQAVKKARRLAEKTAKDWYVFDETEIPSLPDFQVGDDYDADTFFAGSTPVFCTADD